MALYSIPQVSHSKIFIKPVLDAIKLGYRHVDTASVYQTEHSLGDAIAESPLSLSINSHDELFITSKLWCSDAHADHVLPALQKTLKVPHKYILSFHKKCGQSQLGKQQGYGERDAQGNFGAKEKYMAQVCLRWGYERGIGAVTEEFQQREAGTEHRHLRLGIERR
ncbi:hypothetical protein LguiA_000294 [Lonicera macranthoides]